MQRGRGPGEFLDITSMVVDNQDDLIVADHFNMRITRFSNMGLQVETYPIPISGRAQPWHIRTLGPQRFVLYYQVYSKERLEGHERLLHIYGADFRRVRESLAAKSDIWDLTNAFERAQAGGPYSAYIATSGDSLILLVPYFYQGFVYFYKKQQNTWKLSKRMGHRPEVQAYELLDDRQYKDPRLRPSPWRSISNSDGKFLIRENNMSRGIHVLENGTIVHFSFLRSKKGTYIFGIEFFDPSGQFLGYGQIENFKPFPARNFPGLEVLWKDRSDRFYIIDRSRFPIIKRARFVH